MNEQEVRAIINKIVDADKVIHFQQLGINWEPPSNPIFGFVDGKTGSGSGMNQNTSVAESSKHGASKLEGEDKSNMTGNVFGSKISMHKIKNVFKLILQEMPFLVDKKVLAQCEGKTTKEIFTIKIDCVRKALDIETMEDIELLVQTFYEWSAQKKAEVANQIAMEGEDDEEEEQMSPEEIKSNSNKSDMDVRDDALAENDELECEDVIIDVLRDF